MTENKKIAFTLVLSRAASSIKLAPMVIFKRKTLPKRKISVRERNKS